MFHRELKINYGTLGGLISSIESYQSALSVMKQSVEKIWELLEESSGEAYEGLEERKETILGQISSCEGELTDLHDLLAGYSYDMQSVIAPVDGERTMVVDRNDIWFNMQSILSACDRIAAMVYNVNVPWLGTTYTAFAKEEVKEKETKYYNKLEEVQQKIQKKYQDSIAGYKDELVKLYEDKVVVYENTDDVYASKVSKDYYPKYTSLGEGILNVFEWLGDAVTGFVGGVIEGVIGVIDGIGEFLFGIGEFAVSECVVLVNKGMGSEPPDWALKNVKETKEQVGAILDDPMLLVEGMAQGISDTYESEGIWYCAGYAVGTYAGTKGIAEAGKAVKGKVKVKGKVGESGRYSLPQGISQEQFSNASKLLRDRVGDISNDIVVQGSRAKGTAKPTSDIDIALRVSGDKFDSLINQYFKTPNPGSAKERTMLHAIETGKIQAGEAKLSGLRKELQEIFGMEVDISIIKQGGAFDNPPFIPFE